MRIWVAQNKFCGFFSSQQTVEEFRIKFFLSRVGVRKEHFKFRRNKIYRSIKDFSILKAINFRLFFISWKVFVEFENKMPTCSGPRLSKLEQGNSTETKKDVLLLDFPQNAGVRWNKNCPPPNQKGIYTWTSTPRALYQNRKLIRDNLNLQRWVNFTKFKDKRVWPVHGP